jgi:hypothetical protein
MPVDVYQRLLTHIIMTGKFFDGPYNYLTIKMIKTRPDMTIPPTQELIEAIYFFAIDTFPTLVSPPRLVLLFQHASQLAAFLPVSVIRTVTRAFARRIE